MRERPFTQIVFLEYLSRSGSTLLANRLDRFGDIHCSLELDLPQYFYPLYSTHQSPLPRFPISNLTVQLDSIWSDQKVRAWDLEKERVRQLIADDSEGSFDLGDLFLALATGLAEVQAIHTIIFKGVLKNPQYFEHIQERIPGTKLLGIIRDPRAVFSSQSTSKRANSKFPIGYSRGIFIKQWKRYEEFFQNQAGSTVVHLCKYEELVAHEDAAISRIIEWLGIPQTAIGTYSEYQTRIPESQAHLHGNVGHEVITAPLHSWKTRLALPAWVDIEALLEDPMERRGYKKEAHPKVGIQSRWVYTLKEAFVTALFTVGRLGKYFKGGPGIVMTRLSSKLKRLS